MSNAIMGELGMALLQTLYMVMASGCLAALIGIPMGISLFATRSNALMPYPLLHKLLSLAINSLRSIPFIILLVALIPMTRFIVGSSIGTHAAIVPLTVAAVPFIARIVSHALAEVPYGLIEMGLAMGANPWQIIMKILLPETMPGIVNGVTLTLVNLVGYSAMAGAIGGGGLGDLAIRYGYQRFEPAVMLITIVILIACVQVIQMVGDRVAKKLTR